MFGIGYGILIRPRIFQRMNPGKPDYFFRVHCFIIIYPFGRIWNEYINANFSFRLVTVGGKPSEIIIFVDNEHIVIIGRVERHTHIFRSEVGVRVGIVTGDEYVVTTYRIFTIRGIIDGDAICQYIRIVGIDGIIYTTG